MLIEFSSQIQHDIVNSNLPHGPFASLHFLLQSQENNHVGPFLRLAKRDDHYGTGSPQIQNLAPPNYGISV